MAGTYILNLNILPASIHVQNMLVLLQVNPDNAWSCNDLFYIYIQRYTCKHLCTRCWGRKYMRDSFTNKQLMIVITCIPVLEYVHACAWTCMHILPIKTAWLTYWTVGCTIYIIINSKLLDASRPMLLLNQLKKNSKTNIILAHYEIRTWKCSIYMYQIIPTDY